MRRKTTGRACYFIKILCASARLLKGWRVQTGAGFYETSAIVFVKKGVQKLRHAFCHARVLQTRRAQSRTRFEPPFHKIIHVSLKKLFYSNITKGELSSGPLKAGRTSNKSRVRQISRAGKACYFAVDLSRLISSFFSHKLQVRRWSRVAGKACYFAADLSRLKSCFRFIKSRVRQISRAGKACYFAVDLSRLKSCFRFIKSRVRQWSRVAGKACYFAADLSRLKSCFRFIKSRVRQISHVAIPSPVGGFGLVGVFVTSGMSLMAGMAMLRVNQVSVRSVQVTSSILVEQDLQKRVKDLLSDPESCKLNLKPARLASNGDLSPANDESTPADESNNLLIKKDGTVLLKKGPFPEEGVLSILKINFTDPDFTVYYTKPHLGEFSTIGGEECTSTDLKGCYTLSCKMDYTCENDECTGSNDKCSSLNCVGVELERQRFASAECAPGHYVTGFESDGKPKCSTQAQNLICPEGQVLNIQKAADGSITKNCLEVQIQKSVFCPEAGGVVRGISADGISCTVLCSGGRSWNGSTCVCADTAKPNWNRKTVNCEAACSGNTPNWNLYSAKCERCPTQSPYMPKYNSVTKRCEACPNATPWWNGTRCSACPIATTPRWNVATKRCEACPGYSPRWDGRSCSSSNCPKSAPKWNQSTQNCVSCPSGTPKFISHKNSCEACPSDSPNYISSDNMCRACFSPTPKWNGSSCVSCSAYDSATPRWDGSNCVACSSSTPKWNGSSCVSCSAYNSATPRWDGSNCVACPSGQSWNGSNCVCPSGKPHYHHSGCHKCKSRLYYNSRCNACPSGYTLSNGGCCPHSHGTYIREADTCCPNSYPYFHGSNCWNRCPSGTYASNGHGSQCVAYSSSSSSSSGGGNGDGGDWHDYGNDDGGSSSDDSGSTDAGYGGEIP